MRVVRWRYGEGMLQVPIRSRWRSAAAIGGLLLLSGCADGVDLNGKIFDLMGISPSAQDERRKEPQLAERAPLVMPPDSNRLPAPGSGQVVAAGQAWPDDPEERKKREASERERLHLAYCRGDIQWKDRALNPQSGTATSAPRSPYGPCPTIFSGSIFTNNSNKE
jgi:hypothetical protein